MTSDAVGRFLDGAAAGRWGPALLLLLCLWLYLPGIAALPVLDRDEARFMQASRQMLESGDPIAIRFQDEARNKKPAGIYWLQSAAVSLLSAPDAIAAWPYRLPSLLGATAAVLLTFAFGRRIFPPGQALLGAALLASAALLVGEAHIAKTDAALLGAIVAAQGALGVAYCRARAGAATGAGIAFVFWLAQGVGILVKGPVAPLVAGLTILTLGVADRNWRWLAALRPAWGLPLALLIVAPWFVAFELATGGDFAREAIGHDFLGKLVGGQEAHGAPPGYYALLATVTFWPASLFLGAALLWGWRQRRLPAERFLLAWAIPAWLVFELVPTKLPHYILPVYPAFALLAGRALGELEPLWHAAHADDQPPLPLAGEGRGEGIPGASSAAGNSAPAPALTLSLSRARERERGGARGAFLSWRAIVPVLWAIVTMAFAAGAIALPVLYGRGVSPTALLIAAILLIGGALTLRASLRRTGPAVAAGGIAVALLAFPPLLDSLIPNLDALWLSREAAALVQRYRGGNGEAVDAVGYSEPSLVFLLGTKTRLVSPGEAAADLETRPGRLALVADSERSAFEAALASRRRAAQRLGEVRGINYSRSARPVTLGLYQGAPG
jgi:4-amino-4-deoxy-L-arabinose transferase-like glycosyltransferase